MNLFLLALCGIPASGKTILANALKEILGLSTNVAVVSTDQWRDEAFYADFQPENERDVRQKALKMAEDFLSQDISVIHDDTNYYTSMRHELYDIARSVTCIFAVIHVATPIEKALDWNTHRSLQIPEAVVRRIDERLDIPGSKYNWDRPIVKVDLSVRKTNDVTQEIIERLSVMNPVSKDEDSTAPLTNNELLDVVTRQTINRFLEENPKYRHDSRVSKIRKQILKEAKEKGFSPLETEVVLMASLGNLAARI